MPIHLPRGAYTRLVARGKTRSTLGLRILRQPFRHALKLVRRLFTVLGLRSTVESLCKAKTLREQREIWPKIRRALLSKTLHWAVISTEWFAWKAAGVPPAQRQMILSDGQKNGEMETNGEAIWQYIVDTLDPVVQSTLLSDDNYFYLLCLQGHYSQRYDHGTD